MTRERLAALENIGFVWSYERIGEESWNVKYNDLLDSCMKNKYCDVPTTYKPTTDFGRWVSLQRYLYKQFKSGEEADMNQKRIAMLNAIAFNWDMIAKQNEPEGDDEGSGNSSTDSGISRDAILDSIDAEAVISNCNRMSMESFPSYFR
jgi:hypothetical protein